MQRTLEKGTQVHNHNHNHNHNHTTQEAEAQNLYYLPLWLWVMLSPTFSSLKWLSLNSQQVQNHNNSTFKLDIYQVRSPNSTSYKFQNHSKISTSYSQIHKGDDDGTEDKSPSFQFPGKVVATLLGVTKYLTKK